MIDVEIIWKHLLLEAREEILRIGRGLGWSTGEAGQHFIRSSFRADGTVAHSGEVLDEEIDYAIAELLHLLGRKFKARVVHAGSVGRLIRFVPQSSPLRASRLCRSRPRGSIPRNANRLCAVVAGLCRRAKLATTKAATERRCYSVTD